MWENFATVHTSALESFHNVILKYAPKRLFFPSASMNTRMQLAVIDHNVNSGRTSLGQWWPSYRKTTKQIKKGVYEKKEYRYVIRRSSLSHSTNSAWSYHDKCKLLLLLLLLLYYYCFTYVAIPKIHYIRDYLPYSRYVDFYWTYWRLVTVVAMQLTIWQGPRVMSLSKWCT